MAPKVNHGAVALFKGHGKGGAANLRGTPPHQVRAYNDRPTGFVSARVIAETRAYIRRTRGHRTPAIVNTLISSENFDVGQVNGETHRTVAQYLLSASKAKQNVLMGALLRTECRGWFMTKIMSAYDELVEVQRRRADAGCNKVIAIAPNNFLISMSYQ